MKNVKEIDVLIFVVIFCFVLDYGLAQPVVAPKGEPHQDGVPKVRLQRRQQALGSMLGAAAAVPFFGIQAGLNGLSGMGNSLMNNIGYLGYGLSNGLSNFGSALSNGFNGAQYNMMNSAYNMPYLNAYHNPYSSVYQNPYQSPYPNPYAWMYQNTLPYQSPYQNPYYSPMMG